MAPQHSVLRFFDPPSVAEPNIVYSHVGEVLQHNTRLIYISGQIGEDKTEGLGKSDGEQVALALRNLGACLDHAGASVRDIVNLTFYVVADDPMNSPSLPLLIKFLNGHRPTSTCVPVKSLATPGVIFEINAVAAVRDCDLTKISLPRIPRESVDWDVVVVGAGLSGLQAAFEIQKTGLSCLVLEAQDRIGGKTLSLPGVGGKGVVDLGAAFINDSNQSKVSTLAKRLGLELVSQQSSGKFLVEASGDGYTTFESDQSQISLSNEAQELLGQMELLSLTLDERTHEFKRYDSVTLEEFIREGYGDAAVVMAATLTRAIISQEPRELSALSWLQYCHNAGGILRLISSSVDGAQYLRIKEGAQSLAQGIANMMIPGSIITSTPTISLAQNENGVVIGTSTGERFKARRVVVSIPTTVYKQIDFNPRLPDDKSGYCRDAIMGHNTKVILSYSSPWWRDAGLSGEARSTTGPITVTLDSSVVIDEQYSLTGFIAGDHARALAQLVASEQNDAIVRQIQEMFGKAVSSVPEPSRILLHNWNLDPWLQGAPCPTTRPQTLTRYGRTALSKSFRNIHFVGTETADVWTGYMEGALRSGVRGAEEVISALNI